MKPTLCGLRRIRRLDKEIEEYGFQWKWMGCQFFFFATVSIQFHGMEKSRLNTLLKFSFFVSQKKLWGNEWQNFHFYVTFWAFWHSSECVNRLFRMFQTSFLDSLCFNSSAVIQIDCIGHTFPPFTLIKHTLIIRILLVNLPLPLQSTANGDSS